MKYSIGFDPGGVDNFGWCVVENRPHFPVGLIATGVVNHARAAVDAALAALPNAGTVAAVGIDAPLFWAYNGDRLADQWIRQQMAEFGARNVWGTVQAVNSLRGACLAQGILAAVLCRQQIPNVLLTESHPKALLWLLHVATPDNPVARISLLNLPQLFDLPPGLHPSDHERDAALACLSAWGMAYEPEGWRDIRQLEREPWSPLDHPLGYWVPG